MKTLILEFYFLRSFCCYIWKLKRFDGNQSLLFSSLPIVNNLYTRNWDLLEWILYFLTNIGSNILRISDTLLSTTYICWIVGPNTSRMSYQRITLWDSSRVTAWTRFLWYEKWVYFIAKYNSVELLKVFNYHENFLLCRIIVTLWIA